MKTLRFGELEIGVKFIAFNQELIKTDHYNAVTTGKRNVRNFLFSKQNLVKEIKPSIVEANWNLDIPEFLNKKFWVEFKIKCHYLRIPMENGKFLFDQTPLFDLIVYPFIDDVQVFAPKELEFTDNWKKGSCSFIVNHDGRNFSLSLSYCNVNDLWTIFSSGKAYSPNVKNTRVSFDREEISVSCSV